MATATDATRRDLETAIETGARGLDPNLRADFARFARAFLAGVDARAVRTRGADALVALARQAFEVVRAPRQPGERRLRVHAPEDRPGRSVVEVLQDDRPFLVDTVRLALRRRDLTEQLLLHPILAVERDADGRLARLDGGSRTESLIHVEFFPRLAGPAEHAALEADISESLAIVADVTDDHGPIVRAVRALQANVERAGRHGSVGAERAGKIARFLDWLLDRHFVLMGFRAYDVEPGPDGPGVRLRPGSGLGTWRRPETSRFAEAKRGPLVPEEIRRVLADPRIVQLGKARAESRIHRAGRLDRVIVKEHGEDGRVVGFALMAGLFTFRALRTPASEVPLLAERLEAILAAEAATPGSHRHKALVAAFDAAPVEFLLATDLDANAALIREVVDAEGSEDARLVLREDPDGRSFYAAVLLPRERYSEALRARVRELLEERAGATYVDDRASIGEDGSAVLHYFCTRALDRTAPLEPELLEAEVARLAARWEDRLLDALVDRFGDAEGVALAARYGPAFPEALRVTTHPEDAVRDVAGLEAVAAEGDPQFALYFERGGAEAETSTLRIYLARPWLLSDLLPAVDHFGIRVVDARQTRITPADRTESVIATLRVLPLGGDQADLDALAPRLADALGAALRGVVPDDALNGLVLHAGLDWREVDLVRAYIEYFNQIQGALTRPFVLSVLLENPLAVRLLVRLHEARLAPGLERDARAEAEARLRRAFQSYRDRIPSLNEDRALGALYELIDATLRTSFWRAREGAWRLSFKLDPRRIAELRPPKPWREIFVHAADVDGVHLRGGPVARGGLRWSDRLDDFRTEVLGLMRTQMLKNGLIVPVGAKGGFVLKRPGLTANEARAEADRQYRVFVSGLLDLTDNLDAEGRASAPPGVFCRDGEDPYLVVAADKGTAHLSDAANELAVARDFWLGDAFASGGSEGYDHKKYGITARGAFECVRLHFAELGLDPERDSYTVAGIGDMSGDVFGNGLLLMRRAKLVAAFDHRHVLLDPDPDPEVSWRERRRLFELAASSWADYDPKCLSAGGGVWPRGAKRIALDPRVRERLGLERDVVTGQELVRAILAMPVDLLWNGGIGTYVKASSETHADAGDRTNDAVRIDATALRARVVGEGGNLGLTQAARVEAALAGIRLDSDAIHNSGGVDLSDHEVNYKILLAPLLRGGRLSAAERREALVAAADDACESVLSHNRSQALCLSLDERRSRDDPQAFLWAIEQLCQSQGVDPRELRLPDAAALSARRANGRGFTRPELAVLLGLAKLHVQGALAGDALLDRPALAPLYGAYFPASFRARFPEALAAHRLRREITALVLTNRLVDAGGATVIPTLVAGRGLPVGTAVAALLGAEEVLDAPGWRARLVAAPAPREAVYGALLSLESAVADVARYLLASGLDVLEEGVAVRLRSAVDDLRAHLREFLSVGEAGQWEERRRRLAEAGLAAELADDVATFPLADRGVNAVRVLAGIVRSPVEVGRTYARLGEGTGINGVYQRLAAAEASDPWDRMVLADLRTQLLDLQRELTAKVLAPNPADPKAAADAFLSDHAEAIARVEALQQPALSRASASALSVVTQALLRLREPAPSGP